MTTFFDTLWQSLTGGQFWGNLGSATGGDKQWFTIDNTASIGHGFQYQSWSTAGNNYNGRQFSRSTDGGVTLAGSGGYSSLPRVGHSRCKLKRRPLCGRR